MVNGPRMTLQTQLVLRALLEDPAKERYGLEICDVAGLASGTIYPALARLEQFGWVESYWEATELHDAERRPRRRYYRLTPDGIERANQALAAAAASRAKSPGRRTWVPNLGPAQ
jgi:PadR family transcriptional regulator, regulatory protein PadR